MSAPPIPMVFEDDAFRPLPRFLKLAREHYGQGEVVSLAPHEERSQKTHNHYFACVHDAWLNLPEDQADRFPSEDHLRRWALIKAGYCDQRSIVCASKAEALRLAAFMKPLDPYAIVTASEAVVTVYTAKSQSMRAMGKDAFRDSKEAVLGILAQMIGADPSQLGQAA